jgi:L-alanine-DL-glutamate epimerase-like enolase superfamily enzyme
LTDDVDARSETEGRMATISSIEVRTLAPDVERFRYTAFQDEVVTTTTLVRIQDDGGVGGIGAYDSDSYGDHDRAPLETLRTLVPRLIGMDALDRDAVDALLTEDGTSPFAPAVRSTIDIALWDLAARAANHPLRVALGGDPAATSLPSYASIALMDDEDTYVAAIQGWVDRGFGAVKVHAWGDPDRDAELLKTLRARFPSLTMMHDAESRYDRDGAERVARVCAEIGARWLEAPMPDFDLEGYRALRRAVPGVPVIAAGDAFWEPRLIADVVRDPPWDAMRFDVSFAGGITAARSLMAVAANAGMDVELTSYGHTVIQAANLHVALAFGRTTYFEQAVPMEPWEYGARNPLHTRPDGRIEVPDGPGLGIELDQGAIDAATIGIVSIGTPR